MAENSRGQNRNGQVNKTSSPARSDQEDNKSRQGAPRSVKDATVDRVGNNNRTPKTLAGSQKRFITRDDYDGQLSDE